MAIVTTHVAAVQQMYVAYFGRPADTAGLDYWTNVVEANAGATAAVSAAFAASPEYIVTYFGQNNTQIVNNIYQNLFGRDADAAGSAYWANLLTNGTIKVDTIVAEVAKAALTTDKEAVENKVAASMAFTVALDTPAEVAGYQGNSALTLAKAFVKGVTSDATLTAAVAPTALNATVAAVVKAGTPFSLESAIAASTTATGALDDFLEDNDLDDLAAGVTPASSLATDVDDAADDIAEFTFDVDGDPLTTDDIIDIAGFDTARPAVQTALLADAEKDLAEALADATTALTAARAAAGSTVLAIVDNLTAANLAVEEAGVAAVAAARVQNAAEVSIEQLTGNRAVTITYNVVGGVTTTDVDTVTIAPAAAGGTVVTLIDENSTGGLRLAASTITEARYPGVTALLEALRDNQDAQLDLAAAVTAQTDAQDEFDALTSTQADNADAVVAQTAAVAAAQEATGDLSDLVADWEEAVDLQADYTALVAAQTAANAAFGANGYVAPEALTGTLAATSGSDIFVLGAATVTAATISSFGRSGNDSIFLGSEFTLNEGALEDGNNAEMEIFFVQNGTRAEIHVEKAAYGSESNDVTVITLIGVDADDLVFNNGVITKAATTA